MGTVCSEPRQEVQKASASTIFRNTYRGVSFENISGDICAQDVDAIINAANNQLSHNNGLANSILLKGGHTIQEESDKIMDGTDGILDVSTAVVTSGGNLRAKHIIHVVSPIWNGGSNGEEDKLAAAVTNALEKADEYKVVTLAVPCLSAGGFGFPREKCAQIMVKSFIQYLDKTPETHLALIRIVNMNNLTAKAFKTELEKALRTSYHTSASPENRDFLSREGAQKDARNGEGQNNNQNLDKSGDATKLQAVSYSEGVSFPERSPIDKGQDPQE